MEKLQVFLLILQVAVAFIMIIAVLLQKTGSDSLGGIGGGNGGLGSVISSKASANILTKITMILAAIFMLNCLVLAMISARINQVDGAMEIDKVITDQQDEGSEKKLKIPAIPPIKNN